jgi:hypothetical protein
VAEEKLRKAEGSDAQTIFDTEMEAIRNFHIHTPSREAMPANLEQAVLETEGNNNPPPPKDKPQDHNNSFNYIEYYLNVLQRLHPPSPLLVPHLLGLAL